MFAFCSNVFVLSLVRFLIVLPLFSRRTAFAHCYPFDRRGAKVLHTFIRIDTDIVVDLHEIYGGETLRLRETAQNIVLPHFGGIAVPRTSADYEHENAG